jgi:hypothetical protein
MNVRKSDDFIADVERHYNRYGREGGWELADRYLEAVQAPCKLISQYTMLGPRGGFSHPRLSDWRFFLVFLHLISALGLTRQGRGPHVPLLIAYPSALRILNVNSRNHQFFGGFISAAAILS